MRIYALFILLIKTKMYIKKLKHLYIFHNSTKLHVFGQINDK